MSNIIQTLLESQVERFNKTYKPGDKVYVLTRSGLIPVEVIMPATIQKNEVVAWFGNINNAMPVEFVICHQ